MAKANAAFMKPMKKVEEQLTRNPLLPKWDILITPK